MSIPCQILLKPRRCSITAGIPYDPKLSPIHLSHQDPPPELKKEWELLDFDCSITLDRYLAEFHQEILPLPTLDESLDACTLYVQLKTDVYSDCVEKLADFRGRTMKKMLEWWHSLLSGALSTIDVLGTAKYTGKDEDLVQALSRPFMLRLNNNGLELKSWACIFRQVDDWLVRWRYYQLRVERRHAEPHLCTAEWILLYHDTSTLIRSLALRFRSAVDRPSSDIRLEYID
ncbi:hypothetical protein B0H16DRAFT_1721347 [Mycena metata]|uniref:Uncharacterized protein n=1 Tax=Mycena metata TaxID=1033252 RepID=A0AAD7J5I7_9AGAR|nr:hypothetical protein B0H16DRAFT_1721347 [Mycena metata]